MGSTVPRQLPFKARSWELNKCLYGLRQSPRVFDQLLMSRFVASGFKQCESDPCIFRLTSLDRREVRLIIVGVYIDDLIGAGVIGETRCCRELRAFPQRSFPTKDVGSLSYCVGCDYSRDRSDEDTLKVNQTTCIDRLVESFGVTTTSPTHALTSMSLSPKQGKEETCKELFRKAVGRHTWIANATRPDIANTVREVDRQAHGLSEKH